MSLESIRDTLNQILKDKKGQVLAINGLWGIGKTYFWKSYITAKKPDKYAYVSAFGAGSISGLKEQIGIQIMESREYIKKGSRLKFLKTALSKARTVLPEDLQMTKSVVVNISNLIFHNACNDSIICIDDLDRITNESKLTVQDVLAFASYLAEERNCIVVLILNEEKVSDRASYQKLREKVVETDISFSPTYEEIAEVALIGSVLKPEISKNAHILGIKNIRILRKISNLVESVEPLLRDFDRNVLVVVVKVATLMVWSHYDRSDRTPTVDYILEYMDFSKRFSKKIDQMEGDAMPDHPLWENLLDRYEMMNYPALYRELADILSRGYLIENQMRQVFSGIEKDNLEAEKQFMIKSAFDPLFTSFDLNHQEISERIFKLYSENIECVNITDLNNAVKVYRLCEGEQYIPKLLNAYKNYNSDNASKFDVGRTHISREVDDDLRIFLENNFESLKLSTDPLEAFWQLTYDTCSVTEYDGVVLEMLTSDQIYEAIKSIKPDFFRERIQSLQNSLSQLSHGKIADKFVENVKRALAVIASESKLNAHRLKILKLPFYEGERWL